MLMNSAIAMESMQWFALSPSWAAYTPPGFNKTTSDTDQVQHKPFMSQLPQQAFARGLKPDGEMSFLLRLHTKALEKSVLSMCCAVPAKEEQP